jgi:hypothetical protein
MSWVHEELQQKGNNWKAPDSTGRYYPDVPRALAGVVSFAYLAGIFDPEEIIRTSHSQPQLRTLLLGQALFPEDVIAFRRSNRSRLALLLSRVLARAVVWHNGLTGHLLPMDAFQTIHENAAHRVNLGRHMEPDVD